MSSEISDIKSIFSKAQAIAATPLRAAYLDRACGGDAALRAEVERLLAAADEAGDFMDRPAMGYTAPMPPVAEGPGTVIGPYKLMEQIGEGGFGLVFVAEQHRPVRRKVALKVIKPGMDTRDVIARFEAERQALALMDHPNIAKVFDAGATDSGRPYFVMELVRGVPITDYCDQYHLTPRERLGLFISVCHAIQHAHQKGIIHRDVKPTNVLVTLHDGRPVVKVIDFGVAKALSQQLTERTIYTQFAQILGTPLYMSPEQAEMSGLDIDTRSDIYSLGVLLYELFTGTTPFDRERLKRAAADEIRRILCEEDPPRPSTRLTQSGDRLATIAAQRNTEPAKLSKLIRGDLDWIVMKCLEKDRNRRYETANSLARDIERYLHDEPVQASPPNAAYRVRKFARRNKVALVTGALVALTLVLGTAASTWQAIRATHAETLARDRLAAETAALELADAATQREAGERRQAELLAEENRLKAETNRQQVYAARINLAQRFWEKADVANALQLLESLYPEEDQADLRGFEWYYLWRLCHSERLTLGGHQGPVFAVAYSPNGKMLATGSRDQSVKLWRAETGELVTSSNRIGGDIRAVAFSPDGKVVAAAAGSPGKAGAVVLWDVATGTELRRIDAFSAPVLSLAFSPDGTTLATGTARLVDEGATPLTRLIWIQSSPQAGEVQLWDATSGEQRAVLQGETNGIFSVAFSPDGEMLAAASWDQTVRLWDVASGQPLDALKGHTSYVWTVAFSPDGKTLASASGKWDGEPEIRLWDLPTRQEKLLLRGHAAGATSVTFSPDGESLATSSWDRTVKLWDIVTGEELRSLRGHTNYVSSVAFSPDGEFLATASWDGTAKLWDLQRSFEHTALTGEGPDLSGYSLSFSPDGKFLAGGGPGSFWALNVADVSNSSPVVMPEQPRDTLVAFSPDGETLAVGGIYHPGGSLKLYETHSWRLRASLEGHGREKIWTLAYSPDGKLLATGGADGCVRLWDAQTGTETAVFDEGAVTIRTLAFSPDGQTLAASGLRGPHDGAIVGWDVVSGDERWRLDSGVSCECIAFSPDGKLLATSQRSTSSSRVVRLWDVNARTVRAMLAGHTEPVYHLSFTPDGRTLATASWDGTVRLWHVATGQPLVTLEGHRGVVYSVAFSPDGRTLASGGGYRQASRGLIAADVKLWHTASEDEVRVQRKLLQRQPSLSADPQPEQHESNGVEADG